MLGLGNKTTITVRVLGLGFKNLIRIVLRHFEGENERREERGEEGGESRCRLYVMSKCFIDVCYGG